MSFFNTLKQRYRTGNIAIKLIYWNVAIYILTLLVFAISPSFYETVFPYIKLSGNWESAIKTPWTLVSYIFLHDISSIFHLAFNMIMLYVVAELFFRYFRDSNFLTFFLFGGIAGGIAFVLFTSLWNPVNIHQHFLVGASAAVYAVLWAVVAYSPKIQLQLAFLNVKFPLDYLAYGLLGLDVIMMLTGDNIGGRISHLGGIAFGFFYMKLFETGKDPLGEIIEWFANIPKRFKRKPSYQKRKSTHQQSPPKDDYQYQDFKSDKQKRIDEILDKISEVGYEGLTKKEKEILFKHR